MPNKTDNNETGMELPGFLASKLYTCWALHASAFLSAWSSFVFWQWIQPHRGCDDLISFHVALRLDQACEVFPTHFILILALQL